MKTKFTDLTEAFVQIQNPMLTFGGVQKQYSPINTPQQRGQKIASGIMGGIRDTYRQMQGQNIASGIMSGIQDTYRQMQGQKIASGIMSGIQDTAKEMGIGAAQPEFTPVGQAGPKVTPGFTPTPFGQIPGKLAPVPGKLPEQPMDRAVQDFKNTPPAGSKPGETNLLQKPSELQKHLLSRMSKAQYDAYRGKGMTDEDIMKQTWKLREQGKAWTKPAGVSQEDWDKLDDKRQGEYWANERKVQDRINAQNKPAGLGDISAGGEEARRQQRVRTGETSGRVVQPGEVVSSGAVGMGAARSAGEGMLGANWGQSVQTKYTGYYQYPHPKAGMPITAADKKSLQDRGVAVTEGFRFGKNVLKSLLNDAFDPKNPLGLPNVLVPGSVGKPQPPAVTPSGPYVPTPGGVKPKNPKVKYPPITSKAPTGRTTKQSQLSPEAKQAQDQALGLIDKVSGTISGFLKDPLGSIRTVAGLALDPGLGLVSTPPGELASATTGRLADQGFSASGSKRRRDYYEKTLGMPREMSTMLGMATYDPRFGALESR